MLNLDDALREASLGARMLLTVHDELILEVPDHEVDRVVPLVRETLESVFKLKVPLVVDIGIGNNWAEIH